jgi:hypothetical protein
MDPLQMEGYLTYRYEYHFLYISNIEHVESKSIQGASIMKLQFHPGTDMSRRYVRNVVAQVNRSRAFMPPGTAAPFIMRFDAGSVAVGNLVFSTDDPNITLNQMQDQALNKVRPSFATLPGVSAPPPFGGSSRGIVVNVESRQACAPPVFPPMTSCRLAQGNHAQPVRKHQSQRQIPHRPHQCHRPTSRNWKTSPLKTQDGRAPSSLATSPPWPMVPTPPPPTRSPNGKRTVYLPVTKRAEASTLDVVKTVRENIPEFQKLLPEGIKVSYEFDQSPVVEPLDPRPAQGRRPRRDSHRPDGARSSSATGAAPSSSSSTSRFRCWPPPLACGSPARTST